MDGPIDGQLTLGPGASDFDLVAAAFVEGFTAGERSTSFFRLARAGGARNRRLEAFAGYDPLRGRMATRRAQ
jgi:hypothetical protein